MATHLKSPNCILELLTYPNPKVTHTSRGHKSSSNTKNSRWYTPKVVCEWTELKTDKPLQRAFNKSLYEAAILQRQLGSYPFTLPNTVIENENGTVRVITQWSVMVVNAALEPIQGQFNPALWCAVGNQPVDQEDYAPPPRTSPSRVLPPRAARRQHEPDQKQNRNRKRKSNSASLYPDDGAQCAVTSTSSPSSDTAPVTTRVERFPKEYKPSQKWKFAEAVRVINPDGQLNQYARLSSSFWPIRQIFTYCIRYKCRYGCLMTCHEALIFRIQPISDEPNNGDRSEKHLLETMRRHGKMEYLHIPWANHRHGSAEQGGTWTINLALWYFHILAGNDYKIKWKYDALVDETLVVHPEIAPPSPPTTTSVVDITSEEAHADYYSTETNDSSDDDDEEPEYGTVGYTTDPAAVSFQDSVGSRKRKRSEEVSSDSDNSASGDTGNTRHAFLSGRPVTRSRAKQPKST